MKTNKTIIKELEKSVNGKGREAHIAGHEAEDILHDLNDLKEREAKDKEPFDFQEVYPEEPNEFNYVRKQTFPSSGNDWGTITGRVIVEPEKEGKPCGPKHTMWVGGRLGGKRMTATEIIERQMGIKRELLPPGDYNVQAIWPISIHNQGVIIPHSDGQGGGGGGYMIDPLEEEEMERMCKGLDDILDKK